MIYDLFDDVLNIDQ